MTEDTEKRKAAALEAINEWGYQDPKDGSKVKFHSCSFVDAGDFIGDNYDLLRELLQPSPQVPDKDVDDYAAELCRGSRDAIATEKTVPEEFDLQNEICTIVTKYGVRDIYDATTEILLAVEQAQHPRQPTRKEIKQYLDALSRLHDDITHKLRTAQDVLYDVALVREGLYKVQQPLQEWLDIKTAPIDGTPHLLAAYIAPSEEAAKHGSKPYWDFGIGRPIYPERAGTHWTGIVGGNPSHFKYLEPPKEK